MTRSMKSNLALTKRSVEEIIVESDFIDLLNFEKPLRLKMGFDPSAPDIHFGHAVGLRKLRQLQDLGHKVILIVGDWTAQIGDPSGRSQTRPVLTPNEVRRNAETYLSQFFKIVDRVNTEIKWQSEWFGSFKLENVLDLTSRFTVAQMLARDDFASRYKEGHPIAITELLYPLLQAYDSVAVESDVEFGGTDQKFNLLVGRQLQQMHGMRPQQCFLMPLLPGTDGIQKMSKSLGNYISIDDTPREMFGKIMSLPDTMIIPYYDYLSDVTDKELDELKQTMCCGSEKPMILKKRLGNNLVGQFHDPRAAAEALQYFERTVQHGEIPKEIPEFTLSSGRTSSDLRLSDIIVEAKLASSGSEARRLIDQGAVRLDDNPINQNVSAENLSGGVLKVGRRRFLKLISSKD